MKKYNKILGADTGFTLIELMIVIVVIGILSAILIGIINPIKIQNRAKDATTKAMINKVVLATSAYISATGRIPQESEVLGELTAVVSSAGTQGCVTDSEASCTFEVSGSALPVTCSANGYSGDGGVQCRYLYCGGDAGTTSDLPSSCSWAADLSTYKILAKSYAIAGTFMYRSVDSKLYICPNDGSACSVAD